MKREKERHTHTYTSIKITHTLPCSARRLVWSHMLSAWTDTFLSTCPPSLPLTLFLSFVLPPLSNLPFLTEFSFALHLSPDPLFLSRKQTNLLRWCSGPVYLCISMLMPLAGEQKTGSECPHGTVDHFNLALSFFHDTERKQSGPSRAPH